MNDLYLATSLRLSETLTRAYSTSFGLSVGLVSPELRPAIYAVYGMVRLADEIVDTPVADAAAALSRFQEDVFQAVRRRHSSNPILHSYQWAFHYYGLSQSPVDAFFRSMEMDLQPQVYDSARFNEYVHGSAEAIGLLCLPIFCSGFPGLANSLADGAQKLGAAYQKVNFLRDIASDYRERGRSYFPGVTPGRLSEGQKQAIEADIRADFRAAAQSIPRLPRQAQRGVRLSYLFFDELLRILAGQSADQLFRQRASVPKPLKLWIYLRAATGL